MKTLTILVISGLLGIASQIAQTQPQSEPQLSDEQIAQLEQRIADTQARLNLSEQQKEQVRPILKTGAQARRQVLEKHGIDLSAAGAGNQGRMGFREMRSLRSDMEAVREETNRELATVLSDEQFAEWQAIQEERRAEFRERMRARRG